MSAQVSSFLPDEAATERLGAALALHVTAWLPQGRALCVYLEGDLGAGKTALTRALLTALGYQGTVKSPTYTLVESYDLGALVGSPLTLYHFDLYRLQDPEELEMMGIRDYFAQRALCFIEWPERGAGILPPADMTITLTHEPQGRTVSIAAQLVPQAELQALVGTIGDEA